MTEKPEKTCPKCHAPMAYIYGCGWDHDQFYCRCGHTIELTSTTDPPEHASPKEFNP